jgi:glutathione S-transferase
MASTTLILHQYDISPFSQKAQKMMGLKGLSWQSVEMPMIAPKPDVEALTGGYRGTPVLQIGRDVFIDNWMIARALDEFDSQWARRSMLRVDCERRRSMRGANGFLRHSCMRRWRPTRVSGMPISGRS